MSEFLTIPQVAAALPSKPHISTIHRWRLAGVRGIKLRTVRIGGKRLVERVALDEFIAAVTAAVDGELDPRPPVRQTRAVERTLRELRDGGW